MESLAATTSGAGARVMRATGEFLSPGNPCGCACACWSRANAARTTIMRRRGWRVRAGDARRAAMKRVVGTTVRQTPGFRRATAPNAPREPVGSTGSLGVFCDAGRPLRLAVEAAGEIRIVLLFVLRHRQIDVRPVDTPAVMRAHGIHLVRREGVLADESAKVAESLAAT